MRTPVLAAGLALLAVLPAAGAEERRWRLFGFNETTVDYYDVTGDESASPYRFEGTFFTDRLSLGVEYKGDFRSFRLTATGRDADNDYLADESALETFELELEDGSHGLAYRLRVGDLFAELSRRTLSEQIKGVSVELQPQFARGRHSLLLVSGSGASSWQEAVDDPGELYYGGLSYLVSSGSGAHSLTANLVDVDQEAMGPAGGEPLGSDRDHRLASLYGETAFGGLRLEAEVARLDRNRDTTSDEDGELSFYAQLAGAGRHAFAWKLRYEDNGEAYVTPGAVGVIADRRIGELDTRYRFGHGGTLRLRAQSIDRDVAGAAAKTDIEVGSLSYRGGLRRARPTLTIHLSADVHDITAEDGGEDRLFESYRVQVGDRFGSLEGSYEAVYRASDDGIDAAGDRASIEHALTLGRVFAWQGGERASSRLRLAGGLVYREQRGGGPFESWSPIVDLALRGRHHGLSLHLSFLEQDFAAMTVGDLQYVTQRLTYGYERGRHGLSFNIGHELRDPEAAEETRSLRAGVSYRVCLFDRDC